MSKLSMLSMSVIAPGFAKIAGDFIISCMGEVFNLGIGTSIRILYDEMLKTKKYN